jgi:hypothetical protein
MTWLVFLGGLVLGANFGVLIAGFARSRKIDSLLAEIDTLKHESPAPAPRELLHEARA